MARVIATVNCCLQLGVYYSDVLVLRMLKQVLNKSEVGLVTQKQSMCASPAAWGKCKILQVKIVYLVEKVLTLLARHSVHAAFSLYDWQASACEWDLVPT